MAIWLGTDSRIIVQGMTGSEGRKHTKRMLDSGSVVVGGVTPGKGGQTASFNGADLPVFGSVAEAVEATAANTSVVFVPPKFTGSAVGEALDADLDLTVPVRSKRNNGFANGYRGSSLRPGSCKASSFWAKSAGDPADSSRRSKLQAWSRV